MGWAWVRVVLLAFLVADPSFGGVSHAMSMGRESPQAMIATIASDPVYANLNKRVKMFAFHLTNETLTFANQTQINPSSNCTRIWAGMVEALPMLGRDGPLAERLFCSFDPSGKSFGEVPSSFPVLEFVQSVVDGSAPQRFNLGEQLQGMLGQQLLNPNPNSNLLASWMQVANDHGPAVLSNMQNLLFGKSSNEASCSHTISSLLSKGLNLQASSGDISLVEISTEIPPPRAKPVQESATDLLKKKDKISPPVSFFLGTLWTLVITGMLAVLLYKITINNALDLGFSDGKAGEMRNVYYLCWGILVASLLMIRSMILDNTQGEARRDHWFMSKSIIERYIRNDESKAYTSVLALFASFLTLLIMEEKWNVENNPSGSVWANIPKYSLLALAVCLLFLSSMLGVAVHLGVRSSQTGFFQFARPLTTNVAVIALFAVMYLSIGKEFTNNTPKLSGSNSVDYALAKNNGSDFSQYIDGATDSGIHTLSEALYYAVVTHSSVGYGDHSPSTRKAKILVMLHAMFAFFLYSVTLSTTFFRDPDPTPLSPNAFGRLKKHLDEVFAANPDAELDSGMLKQMLDFAELNELLVGPKGAATPASD